MLPRRLHSLAWVLALSLPATVSGQVAFDATSTASQGAAATTLTWSHTTSGTNRALIVACSYYDEPADIRISGVTYNAVGMTSAGTPAASTADDACDMWYLANPATGANDITVTWDASQQYAVCGAVSATGVDQTTPVNGYTSATGSSTTPSVTVTSAANELVVDTFGAQVATVTGPGAGQTQRWLADDEGEDGGGSTEAGAASVTMDWTISTAPWCSVGLNFNEDEGGTGPPVGGLLLTGVGR